MEQREIVKYRLKVITEYTAEILEAFGGAENAENAENYCREIWDAIAWLNLELDKM